VIDLIERLWMRGDSSDLTKIVSSHITRKSDWLKRVLRDRVHMRISL
jgi:hypothetical protein